MTINVDVFIVHDICAFNYSSSGGREDLFVEQPQHLSVARSDDVID